MQTTPADTHRAAIAKLRKRLARWELQHLGQLAASLAEQLDAASARIKALEGELESAWAAADSWREQTMEMVEEMEAEGQQIGLTQSGKLMVVPQAQGSAA